MGGNDSPFTEYKAAVEEQTPAGQPLLPERREEVLRRKRRGRQSRAFSHIHDTGRKTGSKQGEVRTVEREKKGEEEVVSPPSGALSRVGGGVCAVGVTATGRSRAESPWGAI